MVKTIWQYALEKDTNILKRRYFIKYRYGGKSVELSTQRVGITKSEGYYVWQKRWNERISRD